MYCKRIVAVPPDFRVTLNKVGVAELITNGGKTMKINGLFFVSYRFIVGIVLGSTLSGWAFANDNAYYSCTPLQTSPSTSNGWFSAENAIPPQGGWVRIPAPVVRQQPPLSAVKPGTGGHYVYLVERGETLYAVVRKTGIPAKDIISMNRLAEPYNLLAGQQLRLSGGTPSSAYRNVGATGAQTGFYVVQFGDTVYSIAQKTGISIDQLIALNRLSEPYNIRAGGQLMLGKPSS